MKKRFRLPEADADIRHKLAALSEKYHDCPRAAVLERHEFTPDLMRLKVSRPDAFPQHIPGQFCKLYLDGAHDRAFSIVSAPDEHFLEFFVELIPEDKFEPDSLSPRLFELEVGDTIAIIRDNRGAMVWGDLVLQSRYRRHVFVATVTGIAPLVSWVRALRAGDCGTAVEPPLYVFQGASFQDEFGYDVELEALTARGYIVYEKTVSRVPGDLRRDPQGRNGGWRGNVGRVNEIFLDLAAKHGITNDGQTIVYACGNGGMILDLANRKPPKKKGDPPLGKLVAAGFPIRWEKFF